MSIRNTENSLSTKNKITMKTLKVSTKNPQQLWEDITDKIQANEIRTWEYDENKDTIAHIGAQYKNQFHFEHKTDDDKGLILFILHSYGTDFAKSKAIHFLEEMLTSHFGERIEFIN